MVISLMHPEDSVFTCVVTDASHKADSSRITGQSSDTLFSICKHCNEKIVCYWIEDDDRLGNWSPWMRTIDGLPIKPKINNDTEELLLDIFVDPDQRKEQHEVDDGQSSN